MYRRKFRVRRQGVRKAINKARYTRKSKAIINAVSKVNKKINRIAKALPQANRLYYQRNWTQLLGAGGSYQAYNLMKFSAWTRIFGTGIEDEAVRTAHFRSFKLQNYVSVINGVQDDAIQPTSFTYFMVKLTKKGSFLLDESTGELKTLTSGTHWVSTSTFGTTGIGGNTLLNKQFFKIIKYKKFVLGNQNQALVNGGVQSQYGTDRRWDDKITLKFDVTNPSGNWRDGLMPQNPQNNIFVLMFMDNTSLTRQNRWTSNMVVSCDTY